MYLYNANWYLLIQTWFIPTSSSYQTSPFYGPKCVPDGVSYERMVRSWDGKPRTLNPKAIPKMHIKMLIFSKPNRGRWNNHGKIMFVKQSPSPSSTWVLHLMAGRSHSPIMSHLWLGGAKENGYRQLWSLDQLCQDGMLWKDTSYGKRQPCSIWGKLVV